MCKFKGEASKKVSIKNCINGEEIIVINTKVTNRIK